MATSPTTVLEAVNTMLSSIGEAPVNSLASGFEDAELAESIINNVNREVQSKGFVFNTDLEYTLFPGSDGTVHLPANILRVDTTKLVRSSEEDIVERGRKLYDRKNNTFNLSKKTTGIKLDLIIQLDFEDLPEPARRYIALRSARIFQDRVLSSSELHGFQQQDEAQALSELMDYNAESADYSIFDNYDTFRSLDRSIHSTTVNPEDSTLTHKI